MPPTAKPFSLPQNIKLTPMLEQYLRIKQENPDALLFFRMGDFYELFFEDAETAARELQITLTSRNPNAQTRVPMCGVPHHACDEYLRQLLEKGHKVAICDQVEDPRQAKGLVKRAVTRILTPGTVVEESSLSAKEHNYLTSLYWDQDQSTGALCWADFSTGEWTGLELKNLHDIWQWIYKLNPSEILAPTGFTLPAVHAGLKKRFNFVPQNSYFDQRSGAELILRDQQVSSLEVLDLQDKPALIRACGAVLMYLIQTHKGDLGHMAPFRPMVPGRYLNLDEVSIRNLEIFRSLSGDKGPGTLVHALDSTITPMGGRYLEKRLQQPWKESGIIRANQEMTNLFLTSDSLRSSLRQKLKKTFDLERISTRITLNRCTPKDFAALGHSLKILPEIRSILENSSHQPGLLENLLADWDDLEELETTLTRAFPDNPPHLITEGGIFRQGFDPELDELIELTDHGQARLKQLLETEQDQNSLPKLKLGFNRVFGYYFELSRAVQDKVPDHFERRQTLVSSERYVTARLKELENSLVTASEKRKSREYDLFMDMRQYAAGYNQRIKAMSTCLARLDFWQGLAETARANNWSRPELSTDLGISIKAGRHPSIEAIQGRSGYVPNDLELTDEGRMLLITGPNMAGKSTVLRQTAIICILAQMGSFVPAREARIGLCDRIFCRVGASDNLARGQSTFMVEMTETARILRQATKKSLIILDEIGRGTSTFDGLALAWAIVEELTGKHGGIRTLFATHYHELTVLDQNIACLKNFNIAVKEWKGDIVFLRRLVPGPADKSYGIEVARLAGVPNRVVQRAGEILTHLERQRDRKPVLVENRPSLLGLSRTPKARIEPEKKQDQLAQELKIMNLDSMTPMQALTTLHEWKSRLEQK
ncbi:DNA mismatch repair protein MutS [Desulfonatronovibrio hydrogenovorans]|uniref:DNA mismatch repair protein MutS n=1 Tax=Desulfonatronovibrio hydrogenovorans TaxID=53245 RepID=UPI00068FF483|nr:DNA mismatch repair protein MutS [Desulfonatronovibrio hydrogenovorans]